MSQWSDYLQKKERKQKWENWFNKILKILDEILKTPNINIKYIIEKLFSYANEEKIIEIIKYIKKYWYEIIESINNIIKRNEYYSIDQEFVKTL